MKETGREIDSIHHDGGEIVKHNVWGYHSAARGEENGAPP
jgi:hypothetical protein